MKPVRGCESRMGKNSGWGYMGFFSRLFPPRSDGTPVSDDWSSLPSRALAARRAAEHSSKHSCSYQN